MLITPIRTKKVVFGDNLEKILKDSLPKLRENSVVVVTSKIVSITEGRITSLTENKEDLIRQEADQVFVNEKTDKEWRMLLTIKDNIIVPWSGVDESNSNGHYVLWPKNSMATAEKVWNFLRKEYQIRNIGVIIADSTFLPLRTGSVSVGLSWCGFVPIKSLIGKEDVFGRLLQYTNTSFVDGLSIAAGFTMGESNEQQPLAVIEDIPHIEFVKRTPNKKEIDAMHYPLEKDVYGPLIQAVPWEKVD